MIYDDVFHALAWFLASRINYIKIVEHEFFPSPEESEMMQLYSGKMRQQPVKATKGLFPPRLKIASQASPLTKCCELDVIIIIIYSDSYL